MSLQIINKRTGFIFTIFLLLSLFNNAMINAQFKWPENPKNLKVLSKTITPAELRATMFSFTRGLGVRCHYCHVGSDDIPLTEFDFASDEKETKEAARIMVQMVNMINKDHISELPESTEERVQVNCITCHHGQPHPEMLGHILMETLTKNGADAAIAKYRKLRKRFYGGFTYDFRESTLNNFGYQLLGQKKYIEAIKFFELNVEVNPESANVYDSLGEAYMMNGQNDLAKKNYRKSLELNPENKNAKEMLDKLEKK